MKRILSVFIAVLTVLFVVYPVIADTIPAINFESPYVVANINGQEGWVKTGAYHSVVALVSDFTNASLFGFGTQALRIDNAITSGSFGDQTFSPGLANAAGEGTAYKHYEASFDIGSTLPTEQAGLFLSVSPDDGNGSRMSYVGFDDEPDGIHVIFYDVTNPGPYPSVASFNPDDVTTISRTESHSIKFVMDFVVGPANDVVKLYVDNVLVKTGTTWEDYYRYDPEQTGNGNQLFPIRKLLFRVGGTAATGTNGFGYLIENVFLSSDERPTNISQCKKGGWENFGVFKNQGDCVSFVDSGGENLPANQ